MANEVIRWKPRSQKRDLGHPSCGLFQTWATRQGQLRRFWLRQNDECKTDNRRFLRQAQDRLFDSRYALAQDDRFDCWWRKTVVCYRKREPTLSQKRERIGHPE